MHSRPALACALLTWLLAAPVSAQVKPYFLVVFDTSGSMNDAVTPGPTCAGYPATKIGHAKCALTKILNSTGDADFGLMQFAKGSGNTDCGNSGACEPVAAAGWLRVPVETNSWQDILPLIDNNNGAGAPANELCSGGNTPLGGSLIAAKDYYEGNLGVAAPTAGDTALSCRPLGVILLTDGDECCGTCSTITAGNQSWEGCPGPHAAYGINCASDCSDADTCDNNFFESAPEFAYDMQTASTVPSAAGDVAKPIKTYVIGFGIDSGNTHIENIATAGGTDNPVDGAGGLHAFYATDEKTLSAALTQIIADAQPPGETCNNLDDDCDTKIDEGISKFCDKPHGVKDATLCDKPDETKCDGKDDNCDGNIDEGVQNACKQCGDVPEEICDGDDNDCDGNIDEDTDGDECGTDVGTCKKGMNRCVGGKEQCLGGVGPVDEACDCKDNDCDGSVDEDIDNSLCKDGKCIGCECIDLCTPGEEFMPECPDGKRPDIQKNGECLCIVDNCNTRECNASTLKHDDEVACAPDQQDVGSCQCSAGMCVARCDGVSCGSDEICNKKNGRCVENNCRGLGCDDGQLCDPLTVECAADACAKTKCDDTEACRDGKCEKTCAKVTCAEGKRCEAGKCQTDLCAAAMCKTGEVCDPGNGTCKKDPCKDKTCEPGLKCSIDSGDCVRNQCWNVHCPKDQTCADGECNVIGGSLGGERGGPTGSADPNQRVLATGGGGCSCRVAVGAAPGGTNTGWAALFLALGLVVARMRRRGARARWLALSLLLGAALFALTGCSVKPFCIDCVAVDGGNAAGNGGHNGTGGAGPKNDAQVDGDGSTLPDGGGSGGTGDGDGGPKITCMDPQPETCNGMDDDCDFKADEDVPEAEVNDCNQHGVCADSHKICAGGKFICRYPDEREDEETKCDGKDNDCDGRVDETFKELGKECQVGTGACQVTGEQVCNKGGNGVTCKLDDTIDPADEVCDGIDNDCDGVIDEPASDPGSAPSFVHDDVVQVSTDLWIYRYEASRADATSKKAGMIVNRACARGGVVPWTGLTYSEAKAACEAADMKLCAEADWVAGCEGGKSCSWSFDGDSCPTGDTGYPGDASPANKNACNGHDLTATPGAADNDALDVTGAYEHCYSAVQDDEKVYDLSGNAKEWTTGDKSPDQNPLRGGSYNNLPAGMRCDFDFALAADDVRLPNVGFRCCSSKDPSKP